MVGLADIEHARERIRGAVVETPCRRTIWLSKLSGCEVYLKLESLQATGSFKERGALNRLLLLTDAERARGVISASAGNHAQGVAFHAGRLGIPATICMPEGTPLVKATSTRAYGAHVVLHGANYDEAYEEARRLQAHEGRVFVHPFDDDAVIAGQGTIGLELLEQVPELDVAVLAVGGGGLIGGVALALKEKRPGVRVIGVEPSVIPSMQASLAAGKRVTVNAASTIADGIACRTVGERTLPLAQRYVDEVVTVDEEEIASAILLLLEREKTVAEGAGAAPFAGLLHRREALAGKRVVLVLSGGNIDVNLIARIIERGLVKAGRLVRLVIKISDRPGSLARLAAAIAEQRANVIEIFHNRTSSRSALGEALVEVTLETRGPDHVADLRRFLSERGYEVEQEG
ncbi:MAG TPA: threonine ammonia-lyase [Myxococcales bacterium]|nr:threonine ammonia-lyase [Myxococcales bacterium]